ncbi:MAG: translation initiation factor 2 [Thermoanaerobacterales bacterium]|nr:translation initiation factor 2 [Bacillota bacterium]MDI6907167.1 translation initiation factor 2 [Thermoanaerobacterales bacterium]
MQRDVRDLERRVQELEDKLLQLRLSRRVLMHLLERMEQEKTVFVQRLERENKRLHRTNLQFAQNLLQKNRQIIELESKLRVYTGRESGG